MTTGGATLGGPPASTPKGRDLYVILGSLMLTLLLAALDQTIVSTALPTIVSELGGLNHLSWVVTAYLLAATASTPLWGKLGDQYGRKRLFETSIVIFLVGSALCGLAQDMLELIIFRAVQGLGGGGLIVLVIAIVGDVVPPRERGRYQGMFGAVFGVASVVGPLVGGWFVDNLSWRWVFYVNLPIGILALVTIAAVLHGETRRERHRIDYAGIVLLVGWAVALVLLTTWGGTQYDWLSPEIIGLAVAAVLLIAAWVRVERRAAEPVMPPRLFANATFPVGSAISAVVGFAMFGALTFLPLFLQVVNGVSATTSGLHLLPLMAGLLAASVTSGQVISHTGRYKVFPVLGTPLIAVALWLCSRMDENTGALSASLRFALLGLGLGMVMQVLIIAVQNASSYEDLGAATSGVTFFRQIGGSFGVAVFGSIFSSALARNTEELLRGARLPPGFSPEAAQADPTTLNRLPPRLHAMLMHAYSESIGSVFLWAVPVAAVAFVLTWFLRELPLRETAQARGVEDAVGPAPTTGSSRDEMLRALSELMRRDPHAKEMYARLGSLAGVDLPAGSMWALCRISRSPIAGADLAALADVPVERGRPFVDRLVEAGLVVREDDGTLRITERGREVKRELVEAQRAALASHLTGWSPEEHPELASLLTRLAEESLGGEDGARAMHPAP